jgi:hypothetical protein
MLCDVAGSIVAQARASYACCYLESDWAEQDADEVLAAVVAVIGRLVKRAGLGASAVDAIVFGGIWNSLPPLDAEDRLLCRALTWAGSPLGGRERPPEGPARQRGHQSEDRLRAPPDVLSAKDPLVQEPGS